MKTNELKKGMKVLLAYGDKDGDLGGCYDLSLALMAKRDGKYAPWYAIIKDNLKGSIRFVEVNGWETELGSVYAHDIIAYEAPVTGDDDLEVYEWRPIEHTDAQLKLRAKVQAMEKHLRQTE